MPEAGSIIAYNKGFESRILRELAGYSSAHAAWIETLIPRMIDLLVPFRSFAYYHPDQQGKVSLKNVLPALTGKQYDSLVIGNGNDASLAFAGLLFQAHTDSATHTIRQALEEYCSLDTEGMALIVERLRDIVAQRT